jgi:hypothetical protein
MLSNRKKKIEAAKQEQQAFIQKRHNDQIEMAEHNLRVDKLGYEHHKDKLDPKIQEHIENDFKERAEAIEVLKREYSVSLEGNNS